MKNKMNDSHGNNHSEGNYQYLVDVLRTFPKLQDCDDEELQLLAEGIRELSLLIHQLANQADSSDE